MMRQLAVIALVVISIAAQAAAWRVENLRCDWRQNPLGVERAPLSWVLTSDQRGAKQSAYQIYVASSAKVLAAGRADLWDSGKVTSDETLAIEYAGKPLASRQEVFWKVRAWDAADKPSEWSAPATWTMGILPPDNWNAKWISVPTKDCVPGPALYFRHEIDITNHVRRAIVRYSALGWCDLKLDGHNITDQVLSPEFSDLHQRVLYLTHDVTAQLTTGPHALEVILGNGQHSPPLVMGGPEMDNVVVPGGVGTGYHQRWGRFGPPKFLLELEIEYADGSRAFLGSDESWKWSTGAITFNDLWQGEKQDLRLSPANWATVAVFPAPPGRMEASTIPPIRRLEQIKSTRIVGDKIYFDQVAAGWPRLVVYGNPGRKISITGKVSDDFKLPPLEFILHGGGPEVLEPEFYFNVVPHEMEIAGLAKPLTADDVSWQVAHTDLESAGQFECSNSYYNELYRALLRTHLNYNFGQPMDASREKEAWTQDAQNMVDSAVYLTDVTAFYCNWWRDFAANQTPDGYLGAIAPVAGLQTQAWNDPWWSGMIIYLPWKIYEYYGDKEILSEAYEPMKLYLDFLARCAQSGLGANKGALRGRPDTNIDKAAIGDGLLAWGTGDWMGLAKPPVTLTSTAAWAYYAGIVSRTATLLGHDDDAKKYAVLSEQIKARFNQKFLDPVTGIYAKSKNSQSAYALPLSLGLVPAEARALVTERLIDAVHAATNHLNTGFVGTPFLLQCLTDAGQAGLAASIVNQRDYPGWATLMNEGVFKENWHGQHAMMPSLGGPVGAWFFRALLGIQADPTGPGFKHIIIKPEVIGGLTWAKGSYNSARGKISSAWKVSEKKLTLNIDIPANTSATIYVPANTENSVRVNGHDAAHMPGTSLLRFEHGYAVFAIGSGKYIFASSLK